jgi:putative modified peptide
MMELGHFVYAAPTETEVSWGPFFNIDHNRGGDLMSNTRLDKEHAVTLLDKLSSDDDFRSAFEKSPTEALRSLNIPESAISSLDPARLEPSPLEDKSVYARAKQKLKTAKLSDEVCMIVPALKLKFDAKK